MWSSNFSLWFMLFVAIWWWRLITKLMLWLEILKNILIFIILILILYFHFPFLFIFYNSIKSKIIIIDKLFKIIFWPILYLHWLRLLNFWWLCLFHHFVNLFKFNFISSSKLFKFEWCLFLYRRRDTFIGSFFYKRI